MNSLIAIFLLSFVYLSKTQTLQVAGVGQVPATPDEALITVSVNVQNATLAGALNTVGNITANLETFLASQGASNLQVSFASVQQGPQSQSNANGGSSGTTTTTSTTPPPTTNTTTNTTTNSTGTGTNTTTNSTGTGANTTTNSTTGTGTGTNTGSNGPWTAQQSITFLLANLNTTNYEAVIQGVFQNGATSLDSVTFEVSTAANVLNQARDAALADASQAASAIAGNLGVTLNGITAIVDQTVLQPPGAVVNAPAANNSTGNNLNVGGGQILFTANVLVTWNLANS